MALLNGHPADPGAVRALALGNYGHFTTLRVEDQHVRGLGRHLERLVRDCRAVFGTDLDPERVRHQLREAVGGRSGAFVARVTVFDPGLDLERPVAAKDPHVLVTHRPAGPQPPPPLTVRVTRYQRDVPEVKHTALFGALHHRRAAQLAGSDDALFVDAYGHISEGPTWNVGFVDADGTVVWPRADVLPGITMAQLKDLHEHRTVPVVAASLTGMRAAFATNTAVGVREIVEIRGIDAADDGRVRYAPEHPVLARLREVHLALPGERL
ncbi:aminotransferase class IV [Streptomyces odontomachi]|uniref:aminotransferase class IV n=1 Tax=Streptomyces odontomachi TaxID=2944940 RepID=UPI00210C4171|nr:aminotransferase class IV [Streptomyces sp. ODS25]